MHALMEIQRSGAYENKDTRLLSQTQHSVLFHEKTSMIWPLFVEAH